MATKAKKVTKMPVYPKNLNLETEKGRQTYFENQETYTCHADVVQFLKTGKTPLRHHGLPIVLMIAPIGKHKSVNEVAVVYQNKLHFFGYHVNGLEGKAKFKPHIDSSQVSGEPDGVLLPNKVPRKPNNKAFKHMLLINADEEVSLSYLLDSVNCCQQCQMPIVSFGCLEQFYPDFSVEEILDFFHTGAIQILDYTVDETKPLTAAQKKVAQGNRRKSHRSGDLLKAHAETLIAPVGFTLFNPYDTPTNMKWHRPGTILLYTPKSICVSS